MRGVPGARGESGNVSRHGHARVGLVGEDVHVVVAVADEQVVLEGPIDDRHLYDVRR